MSKRKIISWCRLHLWYAYVSLHECRNASGVRYMYTWIHMQVRTKSWTGYIQQVSLTGHRAHWLYQSVWPAYPEIFYLHLTWPLGSQAVHHAHPGFMWVLGSEHRPINRFVHWAISLPQGSISLKCGGGGSGTKRNKEKKEKGNLRILLNCTDTRKQASSLSLVHLSKWGI